MGTLQGVLGGKFEKKNKFHKEERQEVFIVVFGRNVSSALQNCFAKGLSLGTGTFATEKL